MRLDRSTYKALSCDTVVALDFETTGLDPEKDEIIETGMVRLEMGELVEKYSQLYHPSIPIPRAVSQLTGINNQDCKNQPELGEKFNDIPVFLEKHWIIMHNAPFDFNFLSKASFRYTGQSADYLLHRIIDTLDLSRLLLHQLPNHKMETLVEHFEMNTRNSHRAAEDAESAAYVFYCLLPNILALNIHQIDRILKILKDGPDGLFPFFTQVKQHIEQYGQPKRQHRSSGPSNIIGNQSSKPVTSVVSRLHMSDINAYFDENGILSKTIPRFEFRKSQFDMARAAGRIFNEDGFLIAEASTGVGKSLAYLVPALLWLSVNPGHKVIVSTHTKTLQDQLFSKEIPFLLDLMDQPILAVLLKGRGNYLCRRQWESVLENIGQRFSPSEKRKLLPLACWIDETRTGDIEENPGFHSGYHAYLWSKLNSDENRCRGFQCNYYHNCFLQKIRKAAQSANMVVINHSLLFSDLTSVHSVLGEYFSLIVDEAHHLENTASQFLGYTIHYKQLLNDLNHLYSRKPRKSGLLPSAIKMVQGVKIKTEEKRKIKTLINDIMGAISDISDIGKRLFTIINNTFFTESPGNWLIEKKRILDSESFIAPLSDDINAFILKLQTTINQFDLLINSLNDLHNTSIKETDCYFELNAGLDRLNAIHKLINHFRDVDYKTHAVWIEKKQGNGLDALSLYSVPVYIGDQLANSLYSGLKRCIMTSATLAIAEEFDYIIGRWGLDRIETERLTCSMFHSPFDYNEQVQLLVPSYLTNPGSSLFTQQVAGLLECILAVFPKGTLVLFTSHAMLREVYHQIRPALEQKGIRVLGQGIDGSRTLLLRLFLEDTTSVLLGTNSFWEGVDVPGKALELLTLVKIPFHVPTEPLFNARMEWIEQKVGNGFMNYAVPEAVFRFKQGFGRLVRSGEDRGIVLLTDPRVLNTSYGRLFLESLPVQAISCESESAVIQKFESWFEKTTV